MIVRCAIAVIAAIAVAALVVPRITDAAITQPQQPETGPGGSDYAHEGVRVSSGGTGADAWFAFEPVKPRPKKAPLAIVLHGFLEFEGYAQMEALINHTVRHGAVVVYPRWQTGTDLCPGPFNIEPCMTAAVNGIDGALAHLRSGRNRVRPQLGKTSYFGFSFGGIITANLANRHASLGVPKPRAIFLDDPHDGGVNGAGEPALDDSLAGIPAKTLIQCHSSAEGVISEADKEGSSCNALFPRLGRVPSKNKDLVLASTDAHGEPDLDSGHGVCTSLSGTDAYDWGFCWKVWDALRSCALTGEDCKYALGDTRKHRTMGAWSDGVPIAPLRVQETAPIAP